MNKKTLLTSPDHVQRPASKSTTRVIKFYFVARLREHNASYHVKTLEHHVLAITILTVNKKLQDPTSFEFLD